MMETESADLVSLKRWRTSTFLVMLVGYMGYYLCRGNLSAAFPLLSDTFGYTNSELGMLAFYSELAYAAGKFINGPLGDKVGGRPIFLLGMAGAVVFNFVFSLGSSLVFFTTVWCFCRYFLSMGWGGLTKTMGAWYEPERNGTVMGFISITFQFGGVLATLFAGFLVAQGVGWRGLFIYPALVLSAILIWSFFASKGSPQDVVPGTTFGQGKGEKHAIFEDEYHESEVSVQEIIKTLFSIELFRVLLAYSFFTTLLRSIFIFWMPKFFVDLGLGNSAAILKSALFPLLGCIGTIGLGWYTDHYAKNGDRAKAMWFMLLALTGCLLGISYAVAAEAPNHDVILWLTGLCGFFLLGPYSMSSGCLTLDIAGSRGAGSCTGIIDGIGYIGGALSVWGAGRISDELGWSEVFLVLAGFAVVSTAAAYWMSLGFQRRAAVSPH
jgi:MFS transporter, OPA family, glycerol-3-phosphate transporter